MPEPINGYSNNIGNSPKYDPTSTDMILVSFGAAIYSSLISYYARDGMLSFSAAVKLGIIASVVFRIPSIFR